MSVARILRRNSLSESSIDFPKEGLDGQVWEVVDGKTRLRAEVRQKILAMISMFERVDLLSESQAINVIGSITSNLYQPDTDIDVHLVPHPSSVLFVDEGMRREVKKWSRDLGVKIGDHPVELFIQTNPVYDELSIGCYDFLGNVWKTGPRLFSPEYDPYENFSHVLDDVRKLAQEADIDLGELRRDAVDAHVIGDALKGISGEDRVVLRRKLQQKLSEIEQGIQDLYGHRKDWVGLRRSVDLGTAAQDVEVAREWGDVNAVFKFMSRYGYMSIIKELESLIGDDGRLSDDELDKVSKIVSKGV